MSFGAWYRLQRNRGQGFCEVDDGKLSLMEVI